MDESWRMCMGMLNTQHLPHRKSMEDNIFSKNQVNMVMADHNLDADDFSDVFGSPPRSVLSWKLSGEFTWSPSFYEEVFRPPSEFISSRSMTDRRSLPAFRIPLNGKGFYSDIFWSDDDLHRSMERLGLSSNSKAKSMVLISEELSPLQLVVGDDVLLSSFASKLRPMNVPRRWSPTTMVADEEPAKQQGISPFYNDVDVYNVHNLRGSSYHGFSGCATSPEIISLEPRSSGTVKISVDDLEFNSRLSSASSLCHEPTEARAGFPNDSMQQQHDEEQDGDRDGDEDEDVSSYVIEINSDLREGSGEAISIDEAIAWAKERYK